ncbi:MAG: 5'-nucleotidase C-terminal domain-containing protein, partial [Muribaculaceae bacterium]|nr:5'-nucleotidase C-terminal domain-containing protein [Muribaculaceae bacterium]
VDVLAMRNGSDGVSSSAKMTFDPDTRRPVSITINNRPIDNHRHYRLATIDYLANGGDYMQSLPKATVLAQSKDILYNELIRYLSEEYSGKKIDVEPERRMTPIK